jgi:molybdenum-dependent DNA-binding transcriptional regulator ModE
MRFCASVKFAGRTIQISYRTPRELVRALRDLARSSSAGLEIVKIYAKG